MMSAKHRGMALRWFRTRSLVALGLGIFIFSNLAPSGFAQTQPQERKAPAGFPDLITGLKATPGCLGVEAAKTMSGKEVIFAWFEDKKAVLRWYYSDVHQQAMSAFFPNRTHSTPLKDVPDDIGPVMAIASITFAKESQLKETSFPISQISIELYQPVTGGISLGGRFAPDSLKVPRLRDLTPKK